ncbi:MAG TPA: Sec-independent protein translocase protein TatB [Steroidobacteraceae bacterium]|nr:Sec-independent protein translocase protein TatB [Steroidobacteraceae bacterium]
MFEIGFSKIVLIFGLVLVVLGPEKLPQVAATVGRWVGRARAMARQFRDQLDQEASTLKSGVKLDDLKVDLNARPAPPPASPPPAAPPAAAPPAAPKDP